MLQYIHVHIMYHNAVLCCVYVVDGGWSNWSAGNCSKLCEGGTKEKTRSCNSPTPSCGGTNCIGETVETVECNKIPCIGVYIYIIHVRMYVCVLCICNYIRTHGRTHTHTHAYTHAHMHTHTHTRTHTHTHTQTHSYIYIT